MWGVEADASSAAEASRSGAYQEVISVDIDSLNHRPWPAVDFDVILAADVLEHLVDPVRALRIASEWLISDGKVIVSLPNVAHASIRLALLFGEFTYRDEGILDRGHLHLYTFRSARELLEAGGLVILEAFSASNRFGRVLNRHPSLTRPIRGLLTHNIIFLAQPATPRLVDGS